MLLVSIFIILGFYLSSKNFLLLILNFEFLILGLYYFMSNKLSFMGFEYIFCLYFLIFSVCESCLGLGLLIFSIRGLGQDYLFNMNLLI